MHSKYFLKVIIILIVYYNVTSYICGEKKLIYIYLKRNIKEKIVYEI